MELDHCLTKVYLDLVSKYKYYAAQENNDECKRIMKLVNDLGNVYPQLTDWNI